MVVILSAAEPLLLSESMRQTWLRGGLWGDLSLTEGFGVNASGAEGASVLPAPLRCLFRRRAGVFAGGAQVFCFVLEGSNSLASQDTVSP